MKSRGRALIDALTAAGKLPSMITTIASHHVEAVGKDKKPNTARLVESCDHRLIETVLFRVDIYCPKESGLFVSNSGGQFPEQGTIAPGNDPNPPKDTEH